MERSTKELNIISECINNEFAPEVVAKVKGKYIHLTLLHPIVDDCWQLEEKFESVFIFLSYTFKIDFDIVNYNKQTLVIEIYTY